MPDYILLYSRNRKLFPNGDWKDIDAVVADCAEIVTSVNRNLSFVRTLAPQSYDPRHVRALVALFDRRTFDLESGNQSVTPNADNQRLHDLIAWAAQYRIPIFPLFLDGASMPKEQNTPAAAYLARFQGRALRTDTEDHFGDDFLSATTHMLTQLGALRASSLPIWIALALAVCAIGGVFLLTLVRNPAPLYFAEAALAVALCLVTVRIAHSPMGFYYFTMMFGLLACLAMSLGGAVLFAASALGDVPRPGQNPPLAILATVMMLAGLVVYWVLGVVTIGAMHFSMDVVTTPTSHPARGLTAATNIFLSYRRDDSLAQCDRIEQFLTDKGKTVFRDFNSILVGADFDRALQEAIENTATMLALIGPNWLTMRDASGRRRIDDPHDYVRREIALALQRRKRIIALQLGATKRLTGTQVPRDLVDFTDAPSFRIRDDLHFTEDMRAVTTYLTKEEQETGRQSPGAGASRVIGVGVGLALLFTGAVSITPAVCDVRARVASFPAAPCVVAATTVFQGLLGLSLVMSCLAAYAGAIAQKRWRALLMLLVWTALSAAAYLLTAQDIVTIPTRFALASSIAAWCSYVWLLGAMVNETMPTRMHLILNRALVSVT
jgi:hypothetical protein